MKSPFRFDPTIDWAQLAETTKLAILNSVGKLLEGGQEDMALFAQAISDDFVMVVKDPGISEARRMELIAELVGQTKAILETNNVRAINNGWDVVSATVNGVMQGVLGIIAGIKIV